MQHGILNEFGPPTSSDLCLPFSLIFNLQSGLYHRDKWLLFAARGQLPRSRREPAARSQLREPGEGQPAALWDTPLSKVRRCLEPCGTRKNEERNDDQLSTCKKDVLYIFSNVWRILAEARLKMIKALSFSLKKQNSNIITILCWQSISAQIVDALYPAGYEWPEGREEGTV